jgi:pantothenate kinase-related protein Tda10
MRLTPKPLEIGDDEGFTDDNDIFKLKRFGENFANLVQRIDEPLVIALDGPWGSGKSTFAKQWAGLLRQRHVPVIVFDAFANDYQADSFLALAAEIAALARQILPDDNTVVNSFIDKAKKLARFSCQL